MNKYNEVIYLNNIITEEIVLIFHSKLPFKKKCSKCGTVASDEYYFIEQISRTNYHGNLIETPLESRKLSPYCGYIWQIIITTPSLITAWNISHKYSHVTSHWVTWLNFRKSETKWFACLCLTCVKIWSYLHIN